MSTGERNESVGAEHGEALADDPRVRDYFGVAYPAASEFARMLADEGVTRGLIGPREVPRLWERHIMNSAAVAQYLPDDGTLVDVGSGAGLPGVVLACMRPELHVVLVESMERRTVWLREVVDHLGLGNVEVVRARAEETHGQLAADAVTARAVAPMDRLADWTLPLLRRGGVLLALKGEQALDELEAAARAIRTHGGDAGEVLTATTLDTLPRTYVVRVTRENIPVAPPRAGTVRRRRR